MGKKNTIDTINDFNKCEARALFDEHLEQMNEKNKSPRRVFFEILDYLYDDSFSLNYANLFSDEVKGYFTKIAYDHFNRSNELTHEQHIHLLKQEKLTFLYQSYYESSLTLSEFEDKGLKIRNEIEELRAELKIGVKD
ncbi:hypothetical protein KM915_21010 [Cytobacillus oceanisediminis]|uniref:hypothetical protein n=1 Tax=Cytobacillus oceanisediminis TaxID=665099 RepID=UPI001C23C563|nr:hypothetical protein [Cytobacillus oceanisediminis]MBU8732532.1 hypothetical protein [Cytobacillus oceanisediminis]